MQNEVPAASAKGSDDDSEYEAGSSMRAMAHMLGRSVSTISRELDRNTLPAKSMRRIARR
jgi:IS30 family transposase